MRLDRFICHFGEHTRKEARELISSEAVSVNGEIIKNNSIIINEQTDIVCIGDNELNYERFVYLMMNKPSGVLSATTDSKAETCIGLLPERYRKMGLFPVGRLDVDTTGLLILTNDGSTAHRLLSPRYKVAKVYEAEVERPVTEECVEAFSSGVDIGGYVCLPAIIEILNESGTRCRVTVCEGKFHQIKRMFEAVGNRVAALKRVEFAGIPLDESLMPGQFRALSQFELENLLPK